ncbi:DUF5683 domain-containing protein [Taibaiella koreensis]|uniref:DUF5683 domain-containing protein n=1 Tax=Taibaiella koreensis TaxID=1268548 RepID=UPI000E59AF48|nr:DUF5683 domain-containing protein [Taibaiella koreensis]
MSKIFCLFIPLLFVFAGARAWQATDTLNPFRGDTVITPAQLPPVPVAVADTMPFVTPKKIALFSAIVPGLGQYYNKQYWKIPVIYALVGTAIYFVNDNLKNYNAFRRELAGRRSNPNFVRQFPQYTDEGTLQSAQDYYRRNLDLTVLLTGVGYTLQVIDAVVFAHLKGFDISEDISIRYRPVVMPSGALGFGLVMNF